MPTTATRILAILMWLCGPAAVALEPGQPAPPWSLLSSEGTEIDFPRIAEGRPALVLILPPGCAACAPVLEQAQRLRDDYAMHQFEVYAVGQGDAASLEPVLGSAQDLVMIPDGGTVARDYGAEGQAAAVLVDQLGVARLVALPGQDPSWAGALRTGLDQLVAPE